MTRLAITGVEKVNQHIERIVQAAFAAGCIVYLGVHAFPNICFVDKYTLFIFTWEHIFSFLKEPGGGLMAVAGIISQFFYYPWLGIAILTLLLLIIQTLIKRTTGLCGWFLPLTYLPSILLLVLQLSIGYHLYFLLGITVSLVMVWIHSRFTRRRFSCLVDLAWFALCYFLSGSYALLGLLWVVIRRLLLAGQTSPPAFSTGEGFFALSTIQVRSASPSLLWREGRGERSVIMLVLCGALIPWLSAYLIYYTSPVSSSFTGGLPAGFFSDSGRMLNLMRFAVIAATACYLVAPLAARRHTGLQAKKMALYYSVLAVVCFASLAWYAQKQQRLLVMVEMTRYLHEERWNDILALAQKQHGLSRAETVMVNLSLCKSGKLPGSLMDYPQLYASKGMYLDLDKSAFIPFIGSELYCQLGFSNYAYRWAMEGVAMGVFSPMHIRTLLTESIVRREYDLARKYTYYFSHSLFYKQYAAMAADCLEGREDNDLGRKIAEKRSNLPHSDSVTDEFFGFNYRLSHYIASNPGNRETYEYTLSSFLLNKEIMQFARVLEQHYPPGAAIPALYQQALAIHQVMLESKGVFDHKYNLSPELLRQFNKFNATFRAKASKEQAVKEMAGEFGKTYWYYYVLTEVKK